MILNIFYSIFFLVVNLLIYLKLEKSFRLPQIYIFIAFIAVILIAHVVFVKNDYLMSTEDFFNLSFFSAGLVILHFASNVQVEMFKKYNKPQDERGKKLQLNLLLVYDFMRQKLIYIMVYIYQFFAVWNERFR